MISIKKKNHTKLIKLLITVFVLVVVLFFCKQAYITIANKQKIENLTAQISTQKSTNNNLISKTTQLTKKIDEVKKSYPTTEELEEKLNGIFKRMSILDYQLALLGTKKICIDRHVLITKLESKTKNGAKAALGILNYLGKTKQSDKDENIYFVDYVAQKSLKEEVKK